MKKFLVALLMVPSMASAEFLSGNDLYTRMTGSEIGWRMYALGYVVGVYDVGVHIHFCPASETGITAGQVRDIAEQFLAANPGLRDKNAYMLVRESFRQVWPCPNRGRGA